MADVGYVRRLDDGLALDVGASAADVYSYRFPRRREQFGEVYAGLVGDRLSVHLHYSPDYFHAGASTLYADLDGAVRPADGWRLFGHLGALTPLGAPDTPGSHKERYDLSAGVARQIRKVELSLMLSGSQPTPNRPNGKAQDRDTVVLSASYFF